MYLMSHSIMGLLLAEVSFLVPGVVIAVVIALAFLAKVVASRYKTVPPNAIGVFYGRKYHYRDANGVVQTRGFRIVTGGGSLLLPVVEKYQEMSTAAYQVDIEEKQIPTKANVPVEITAVATCQISTDPQNQASAVQAFLGKTPEEQSSTVSQILRGHIRSIIAGLTVEEVLRDRQQFNTKVLEESGPEMKKLGIEIVTLVVQDVRDSNGYIEALGRSEITAKVRDAKIQTAENEKATAIAVSNANREAAEVAAQNDVRVAEAQKTRDIRVAEFKTETETKRAQAEMANAIAKTSQEKELMMQQAERDRAAAEAGVKVQQQAALRREQELIATTIKQAEADARAAVIKAEAAQQVASKNAQQRVLEAEGARKALEQQGAGEAAKNLSIAQADAEAIRIRLVADADGQKAALLATAEGKRVALLAEAEGTSKLAEALRQLDDKGKMLMVLDRVPVLLDKGGEAGAKVLGAVFKPIGDAVSGIDSIRVVDMGGGGGKDGESAMARFAGSIPEIVTKMLARAEAQGVDLKPLLKLARVDTSKLSQILGFLDESLPDAPAAAAPIAPVAPAKK